MIKSDVDNFVPNFSNDAGNKWIKASPNNPPTAKHTRNKVILCRVSRRNTRVKIPINESRLTMVTLTRA